jgi:hypothetical protein
VYVVFGLYGPCLYIFCRIVLTEDCHVLRSLYPQDYTNTDKFQTYVPTPSGSRTQDSSVRSVEDRLAFVVGRNYVSSHLNWNACSHREKSMILER